MKNINEDRLMFKIAKKITDEQEIYCSEKECEHCPYCSLYRYNSEYYYTRCRITNLISKLLENPNYLNELKEECERECK